ncbi:MAG TPA: hypothetical protein VM328_05320, partial [Fimbriimonadaceae bacterium]|nr:hypothetical protein [Fimbriimonadaceae bacterium]
PTGFMLEETTVFLLESLLWKVLLEDGAVVTHIEGTTAPYTTDLDTNPLPEGCVSAETFEEQPTSVVRQHLPGSTLQEQGSPAASAAISQCVVWLRRGSVRR